MCPLVPLNPTLHPGHQSWIVLLYTVTFELLTSPSPLPQVPFVAGLSAVATDCPALRAELHDPVTADDFRKVFRLVAPVGH